MGINLFHASFRNFHLLYLFSGIDRCISCKVGRSGGSLAWSEGEKIKLEKFVPILSTHRCLFTDKLGCVANDGTSLNHIL